MNMKSSLFRIYVLGYFGFQSNQLDGQTVKTRNVYDLFREKEKSFGHATTYFDTEEFKNKKMTFLKTLITVSQSDVFVYLPAHNNLKFLFPIYLILCKLFRTKMHYIVIGGWLEEFLKKNPFHQFLIRKVDFIYPENKLVCDYLKKEVKCKRVFKLHNFRNQSYAYSMKKPEKHYSSDKELKFVYLGRVTKMKGIDWIFSLSKALKDLNCSISIYGPISDEYYDEFNSKFNNANNRIIYKGVLNPDEINNELEKYDLMLFPTQYYTEGLPGTILDAYFSGVPVVSTDWKHAKEFMHEKCTIRTPFNERDEFVQTCIYLVKNPSIILKMKNEIKNIVHQYDSEFAWGILKKNILIK